MLLNVQSMQKPREGLGGVLGGYRALIMTTFVAADI